MIVRLQKKRESSLFTVQQLSFFKLAVEETC